MAKPYKSNLKFTEESFVQGAEASNPAKFGRNERGLKVATVPDIKCKPYNDINLREWKNYSHIKTDTWWEFAARDKSGKHSNEYHGNYIPQLAEQFFERFTKKRDIILDLFLGSGTSAIQAVEMERRCIGVELKDALAEHVRRNFTPKENVTEVNVITGNSADEAIKDKIEARLEIMGREKAQFLVLHPPYDDIIKFSDKKEDLSNCSSPEEFYDMFEKVAQNGFEMLEDNRFAALIIGDEYKDGECKLLSFECAERMKKIGFKLKGVIVKNIEGNERAKGKTANLWRYRALNGGFFIFRHEYIFIFEKPACKKRKKD